MFKRVHPLVGPSINPLVFQSIRPLVGQTCVEFLRNGIQGEHPQVGESKKLRLLN